MSGCKKLDIVHRQCFSPNGRDQSQIDFNYFARTTFIIGTYCECCSQESRWKMHVTNHVQWKVCGTNTTVGWQRKHPSTQTSVFSISRKTWWLQSQSLCVIRPGKQWHISQGWPHAPSGNKTTGGSTELGAVYVTTDMCLNVVWASDTGHVLSCRLCFQTHGMHNHLQDGDNMHTSWFMDESQQEYTVIGIRQVLLHNLGQQLA